MFGSKMISRWVIGLALAGFMTFSGASMLQDYLLYYPTKTSQEELAATGLRPWPATDDFRGLLAESAGPAQGTIIIFHGNAGHAGHRYFYAQALNRHGFRVILAEYPGYGPRPGRPQEKTLVSDAESSIALARHLYGTPLLVVGESLGAAVAAEASAGQKDKITGLLLLVPWDRLENIATRHYPWLPVKWLLTDPYDSAAHLATFDRPVQIVVAELDNIVPARFGKNLYEGLTAAPKRLIEIPGAEHNDWPGRLSASWWKETMEFLLGQ